MSQSTPDQHTQNDEPQRDNPSPAGEGSAPAAEGDTAPTEVAPTDGSASTGTADGGATGNLDDRGVGISDDQLPEDLQPTDDNPLAKPPSEEDEENEGMSLGPDGSQA
jgi:hypothetical protein